MPAAATAIPPNPSTAAIIAIMKKTNAQRSISVLLESVSYRWPLFGCRGYRRLAHLLYVRAATVSIHALVYFRWHNCLTCGPEVAKLLNPRTAAERRFFRGLI